MQQGFFNDVQHIALDEHASVNYWPEAFVGQEQQWYTQLLQELDWQQDNIVIAGKQHLVPRLQAYISQPELAYSYSGIALKPMPWTPLLDSIKTEVEQLCGQPFNAVLCNYYRDGSDSVAWHSDDEPELGSAPIIASVSLGAPREFHLRNNITRQTHSLRLSGGSLLLMNAGVQQHYQHAVLKEKSAKPRINLTFRQIIL